MYLVKMRPSEIKDAVERNVPVLMAAWLGDAKEADREEGRRWLNYCVEGWVRELTHRE